MAVWASVKLSELARGLRLDAEYYQPFLLQYERDLSRAPFPTRPLGELVRDGYRVVYENTEIIEAADGAPPEACVRFLQAADINLGFPTINAEAVGWVSRDDWERYPKGRIEPGEVLIEVKGLARKVAIVPDDFPKETLVTGSVFKLQTDPDRLDPHFLLTYLLSRYGIGFRFRCLTNTLIGFVNKTELYNIPTPEPPMGEQRKVGKSAMRAIVEWQSSSELIKEAETRLMETLGLDHLDLSSQKCYSRPFGDLEAAGRFGSEYFMPCKKRVLDALAALPHRVIGDCVSSVRSIWNPKSVDASTVVRNFDVTDALEPVLDDSKGTQTADEIGSAKKQFQAGDVVVSRLRSYLREIAVVRTSNDIPAVGSSEFIVLRPTQGGALSAEALMVFVRCPLLQTVLKWSQDGSNHPRFAAEDLLAIPVPDKLLEVQDDLQSLVNQAIDARRRAVSLFDEAKLAVESMIVGKAGRDG